MKRHSLVVVALMVAVSAVALALAGSSGATAGSRVQTLLRTGRRIYAFAQARGQVTWISRTHMRGRYTGCEMYVRTLRSGLTSQAPLPSAGCGVTPSRLFVPQAPVLVEGVAAWVTGSSCGNNECFWKIATITGGEKTARVVENADISCDYTCDASFAPQPALAGAGKLLVYSAGLGADPDTSIDHVRRIIGRRTAPFAAPPGGGDVERLTIGGGAVGAERRVLEPGDGCGCLDAPAWSPDGSKVAYLHGEFSNQQADPYPPHVALAVMNADGSGRHDLTAPAQLQSDPSFSWSPDGKQIAYATNTSSASTIAVVNTDGSGSLQLGSGFDPTWSPDGSKIAFAGPGCGAISVMNPDGTNVHQLASLAPSCIDYGGMAWSPDGTRIAFSVVSGGVGTLEVMNADGTNIHPLGRDTVGTEPSWSPDSGQIVFHDDSGLAEIGADGTNLRQLTDGPDEYPSWSPDGHGIVFGSDRNDPYANIHDAYPSAFPELYLVNSDGSNLHPLSFTKPAAFVQQLTLYAANGKRLPPLPGVPTLAGQIAAVGSTSPSDSHEITLFSAASGAQLAQIQIGAGRGRFALAGGTAQWIAFQLGRTIAALNTRTHQVIHLASAAANPVDLSLSGRRVAWAENINGRGRVRAVELPS